MPSKRTAQKRKRDYALIEFFFASGAILVVVGLLYAIRRSWPALDPLSLVMLVGMGLLLVVVCERLRLILQELRELTTLIRAATVQVPQEPSK
jgi:type III secretory pathway component EscT